MKKIPVRILALASFCIMGVGVKAQTTKTKVKTEPGKVKVKTEGPRTKTEAGEPALYPVAYSAKWVVTPNPVHTGVVMEVWKAWEDNTISRSLHHYDNDVAISQPNGDLLQGREKLSEALSLKRDSLEKSVMTIESITPLRSIDQDETWVAVWGTQEDIDKNGNRSRTAIHELWRFSKNGKVNAIRRFAAVAVK